MKTEAHSPVTSGKYRVTERLSENSQRIEDIEFSGLTKREYFAALIMQGYMANPNPGAMDISAHRAVEGADMLINELNK